jgi:hypothetical protein
MIDISVVIPTRNRPGLLGRCLASLCEQTLPPARFEICVVNNGAADMVEKVLTLVAAHYPNHRVTLVTETILGVAAARNAGLRQVMSPLVAMGDDDMTAPPDWLEKMLTVFAPERRVVKIGGEIDAVWAAPRPDWLTDDLLPLCAASSGLGGVAREVDCGLMEGNSCYRREALMQAGGFPVSLGRKGSNLLSGEGVVDQVLRLPGNVLRYDPAIRVSHTLTPERVTPVWWRRRLFWQGVSDFAAGTYLQGKNLPVNEGVAIADLPLGRDCWSFINDASEAPTADALVRLRGLGHMLAKTGFIPT